MTRACWRRGLKTLAGLEIEKSGQVWTGDGRKFRTDVPWGRRCAQAHQLGQALPQAGGDGGAAPAEAEALGPRWFGQGASSGVFLFEAGAVDWNDLVFAAGGFADGAGGLIRAEVQPGVEALPTGEMPAGCDHRAGRCLQADAACEVLLCCVFSGRRCRR